MELLKSEMGEESKKQMEELIKQGRSKQEVMKMMMASGKLQEEETRDTAETMKHIMTSKKKNIKMSQKELKEMLNAGVPLKEVLDHFAKQCDPPEAQLTEMEKK